MDQLLVLSENKYSRSYFAIVEKARSERRKRVAGSYYERHHVLPKCLYPEMSGDKENLVLLTAREHFVCHWLLTKMVSNERHRQQLLNALGKMMRAARHERGSIQSGWRYEVCRRAYSERNSLIMSRVHKGKTISPEHRERIRITSSGRLHTPEAKAKISAAKRGVSRSEETKAKCRLGMLKYVQENGSACQGTHWPEASKNRLKAKFAKFGHHMTGRRNPAPSVTCPHCGASIDARNAGRWHLDNCKQKEMVT